MCCFSCWQWVCPTGVIMLVPISRSPSYNRALISTQHEAGQLPAASSVHALTRRHHRHFLMPNSWLHMQLLRPLFFFSQIA